MEDNKLSKFKKYSEYMEQLTLPELNELKKAISENDDDKIRALMAKSASKINRINLITPYLGKELSRQQLINFMKTEMPELKNMSDIELAKMMEIDPKKIKIGEGITEGARGKIGFNLKNPKSVSKIELDPSLKDEGKLVTLAHEFGHEKDFRKGHYDVPQFLDEVPDRFVVKDIYKDPVRVSEDALRGHHWGRLFEFDNLRNLIKSGKLRAVAPVLAKAGLATAGGIASLGAEAAQEAFDAEEAGATKQMPEHYLETGTRDPEEARQKALAYRFKQGLESKEDSKMPSRFEKPEIQKYKEDVMKAKEEDLLPNYVEQIPEDKKQNFNKLIKILR